MSKGVFLRDNMHHMTDFGYAHEDGPSSRGLLAKVEKSRTVQWVHVKGHSGDGGNDRADELVQWGKEDGPYAGLRALGAGEGDSRFGAAIRENSSLGSEKRVDSRGSGELHRGHK